MKVCLIFRGENIRNKWGSVNALNNINNWNRTIFDDLKMKHIDYDIYFFTYHTEILEDLEKILNVKKIFKEGFNSQNECMDFISNFMIENKNLYDRFVILRFDFLYRLKITEWNNWNSNGIILVNKDVNWPTKKLYADIIFIIDKQMIETFQKVLKSNNRIAGHTVGKNLFENNINFYIMYEDFYHMDNHPLHALALKENINCDLDKDFVATKVLDLSPWN
jgi:hypothetical protein